VADQAKYGRKFPGPTDDSRRQRRPRVDGLQDIRFRRRAWDVWEPEEDIYWGPEGKWLADERYSGERDLQNPLAAVQMGLIYVNPEGPNGKPDPIAAAKDIRETFRRMAMNDEETVALIAGGQPSQNHAAMRNWLARNRKRPPSRSRAWLEEQVGTGKGETRSAAAWKSFGPHAYEVEQQFLHDLFSYEWELTKSPAGAHQWKPKNGSGNGTVPDAHDASKASRAIHVDH